ncbi:hypothetical protein GIB67_020483 [Kingdonia uniflora]|uniref:Uncharacterized protein n=1 Tax=Kingdonia uniflora TaxID=39325 RepID=A0A7J7LUY5_9MAGN|nr:hypothetical protein GIB67_020483 [Kingdonia uniflora]
MQAQHEAPLDLKCKDKFLIQSFIASYGVTKEDIKSDMFCKELGNVVEEYKFRVAYVSLPQPSSLLPKETLTSDGDAKWNTTNFTTLATRDLECLLRLSTCPVNGKKKDEDWE